MAEVFNDVKNLDAVKLALQLTVAAIDDVFGPQYAIKNPSLVAQMLPNILSIVIDAKRNSEVDNAQ